MNKKLSFRWIKRNDLTSEKNKKICKYLNYIELLFIFDSRVTGCVSIAAFASLVTNLIGIISSVVGIKICSITAGIKK